MQMKKALTYSTVILPPIIIGATIMLWAGTAHAYPARHYDCGMAKLRVQMAHGSGPHRRVFPVEFTLNEDSDKEDRGYTPISVRGFVFRCASGGGSVSETGEDRCWLNGKLCRPMNVKKARQYYPEDFPECGDPKIKGQIECE